MKHIVNVKMVQFAVNSNKATTGHKLQGVTLKKMVVRSWNYRTPNWVYVVLSRVRSFKGLFICEKLNEEKTFVVDPRLLQEEERLKLKEKELLDFLGE